jgi:metal-sulfur cluster biosynthetic enzyme
VRANITMCKFALQADARAASEEVLSALRRIMDPDFGEDIVSCGFVKSLNIDPASGAVSFTLELTTPACPVKDQFKREATQYVQVRRRQGCSEHPGLVCWPGLVGSCQLQQAQILLAAEAVCGIQMASLHQTHLWKQLLACRRHFWPLRMWQQSPSCQVRMCRGAASVYSVAPPSR